MIKKCIKPLLIWLISSAVLIFVCMAVQNSLSAGRVVKATVVDTFSEVAFYSDEEAEEKGSSSYMQPYLKLKYEVDGKNYKATSAYYQGQIGDEIKISVDKKDYENILDKSQGSLPGIAVIVSFAVSTLITIGLCKTKSKKKKKAAPKKK